jgi:hypothetical protein
VFVVEGEESWRPRAGAWGAVRRSRRLRLAAELAALNLGEPGVGAPGGSSRNTAEYNVAAGVLPPGEVQYPLAAIASIISWQFIG